MNVVELRPVEVKKRTNGTTLLPSSFCLTPELRRWAQEKGITRLQERFEHFTDLCAAKEYRYASFEAAFRNACRQDWARLGGPVEAKVETCSKCRLPLNGYTLTREGKLCNSCWSSR